MVSNDVSRCDPPSNFVICGLRGFRGRDISLNNSELNSQLNSGISLIGLLIILYEKIFYEKIFYEKIFYEKIFYEKIFYDMVFDDLMMIYDTLFYTGRNTPKSQSYCRTAGPVKRSRTKIKQPKVQPVDPSTTNAQTTGVPQALQPVLLAP
ncbi:hypothetical protein J7T55_003173 [Diaporthe amygdali]|uniref:uncharacterized protein n=1 Tax=Phomopsis amygdali TaxID=1214568 RepID=UPI0022FDDF4C|nr:uncharacterized protein J7T55_003173 [Diaporthe amygdali]KAJ0122658.1 hypothetical protein J7T55_003173 [Diaporthe amygdali]